MALRRLVTLLAVAAALSVLCLLVWKSQQRPLDGALVGRQMAELSQLRLRFEQLLTQLDRARVGRDTVLADLDAAEQDWSAASEALNWRGYFETAKVATRHYKQGEDQLAPLLQRFRDQQLPFVENFQAFRAQAEQALQDLIARNGDAQLQAQLINLLDQFARYSLQSQPDNAAQIRMLLDAMQTKVPGLVGSALQLQDSKDALQLSVDEVFALNLPERLDAIAQYLDQAIKIQEQNTRQYTIALAAFAATLLTVFGLIGLRLQGSYRALDAINNNLEMQVTERTGELNQALAELREKQAHLIQSEKLASLGQMVAGVAHEINTPLGYALSNVQTVKDCLNGDEVRVQPGDFVGEADILLSDAMYGMRQIDELVLSLKDFSRVDRSATEVFDLNAGIEASLKMCQSHLGPHIKLRREFDAQLPHLVCAPTQMNQVFHNLIINAAQAVAAGGHIDLKTWQADGQVHVSVKDDGAGIDPEIQARVFEPFFTTKPVGEGTGLGLSIAYRIIEEHGGRLQVQSTPGQGAEFRISLPLQASAPAEPAGRADAQAEHAVPA